MRGLRVLDLVFSLVILFVRSGLCLRVCLCLCEYLRVREGLL